MYVLSLDFNIFFPLANFKNTIYMIYIYIYVIYKICVNRLLLVRLLANSRLVAVFAESKIIHGFSTVLATLNTHTVQGSTVIGNYSYLIF